MKRTTFQRRPARWLLLATLAGSTAAAGGAQAQPVPATPAPPAPTAPPPAGPAAPSGQKPKSEIFEPGLLLQVWMFLRNDDDADPPTSTTLRIRRAELKASGTIVPDAVQYKVMFDPAKVLEPTETEVAVAGQEPAPTTPGTVTVAQPASDLSVLQDAQITFLSEWADVSVGQFKNPLSWEGYNSSSKLLLPDRSLVSKAFGDQRDLGVTVGKKLGEHVSYSVGVWNGGGLNTRDTNNQKDASLRVEVFPVEELMVGGVAYGSVGQRGEPGTRDVYEGDLRLDVANVLVQGEYLWQRARDAGGAFVEGHGFYGAVGYTFLGRVQPVVRIGLLDEDLDAPDDRILAYEGGVNVFLRKRDLMLQSSYSYFDGERKRQDVILSAQVAY